MICPSIHRIILLMASVCILAGGCNHDTQSGAAAYLDLIKEGIAQTRSELPSITASAEQAAKLLLSGGNIWITGSQGGFDAEASGRAGGLMSIRSLGGNTPDKGDIVLVGSPGALGKQDLGKMKLWKSQGIYVVAFASRKAPIEETSALHALISNLSSPGLIVQVDGEQKLIPVDTVLNVINLWVWTGELTAACTRAGKMPVHYMSYGLPGGRERAKKYEGQVFHDDFQIAPVKSGLLGSAYLNVIETAVNSLRTERSASIHQAGRWWQQTKKENVFLLPIGHLFPIHLQDSRAPQKFNRVFSSAAHNGIDPPPGKEMFVLALSYQLPPEHVIAQAKASDMKFVYNSVTPADPAEPAENIIYIKPGWFLPDACVKVPGYDVAILPASGAVSAIIYWSILSEACALPTAP